MASQPARPASAYWLWLGDKRKELEKEAGVAKGSVVSKLAGEKWKNMSEEEKKPYNLRAIEAKQQYEKDMEAFKSGGGEVVKRKKKVKEEKKKGKSQREEGKPKKPPTGFWLWQCEVRESLVKEAGTNSIPVIGKLAGEKWKVLSAEEKKPYEEKAEVLKKEHTKAVEEWKATRVDQGEAAVEKSPPGKGKVKVSTPAKRRVKESTSTPPKRSRHAAGEALAQVKSDLPDAIVVEAEAIGYRAAIENLAARVEVAEKGFSGRQILDALKSSGGLVNKAKHILLGGA